jgi:hypothetical protein
MIVGLAEEIASRTIEHLSGSPKPRTFQDRIERERFEPKFKLLIENKVAPRIQENKQVDNKVFAKGKKVQRNKQETTKHRPKIRNKDNLA